VESRISSLLKQRGHDVIAEGDEKDILLPSGLENNREIADALQVVLYNLIRRDSNRRALRDWAFGKVPDSTIPRRRIDAYIELCSQFGDWKDDGAEIRKMRYAKTFEWFVSELLRREFAARASGFSLRLKDALAGDEFDCIALLDDGVVFVECKTGKNEIYEDIAKFARRDAELAAAYSFYLFDRDYTFQREGDDLPQITRERARQLGILGIFKISVGPHKFFEIWSVPNGGGFRFLLACPSFDRLEERIRYMIRFCRNGINLRPPGMPLYNREEIFCYGPDPRSIG
jgi:hypothetical protein